MHPKLSIFRHTIVHSRYGETAGGLQESRINEPADLSNITAYTKIGFITESLEIGSLYPRVAKPHYAIPPEHDPPGLGGQRPDRGRKRGSLDQAFTF